LKWHGCFCFWLKFFFKKIKIATRLLFIPRNPPPRPCPFIFFRKKEEEKKKKMVLVKVSELQLQQLRERY